MIHKEALLSLSFPLLSPPRVVAYPHLTSPLLPLQVFHIPLLFLSSAQHFAPPPSVHLALIPAAGSFPKPVAHCAHFSSLQCNLLPFKNTRLRLLWGILCRCWEPLWPGFNCLTPADIVAPLHHSWQSKLTVETEAFVVFRRTPKRRFVENWSEAGHLQEKLRCVLALPVFIHAGESYYRCAFGNTCSTSTKTVRSSRAVVTRSWCRLALESTRFWLTRYRWRLNYGDLLAEKMGRMLSSRPYSQQD